MRSRKALSEHFLVSLILGVLIFAFIITRGCGLISFTTPKRQDMIQAVDANINTLMTNTQGYSSTQMVLILEKEGMFFGISPNAEYATYSKYSIERPATCKKEATCICYCDKTIEKSNSLSCKNGKLECKQYVDTKFRMLGSGEAIFGEEVEPGVINKDGFVVSHKLSDMPSLEYRNDMKIQKLSTKEIVICFKKDSCIDELKP